MSDIYIPGLRSRFNSEKIIEDLMRLERVPKVRSEGYIEKFETEKGYWQEVNRKTNALRDSARMLFSFQNPFNDRTVRSSDDSVLSGIASREAIEQSRSFTVKQLAQADRFLSRPMEPDYTVESGSYTFSVGRDEISFDFRGGSLKDFSDALNRRGRDILQSSIIAVKSGTLSLLIESKATGEDNALGFAGAAVALGENTGMIEQIFDDQGIPAEIRPLNAVSKAQDTIISMEGIQIQRSGNVIDDLIPGVTITAREVSDKPVKLEVESDNESVKDAIITMVGNYNRLMAELNVLTRNDTKIIDELSYLTKDERDDYRQRLGAFSGDSTLMQMRNSLLRIMSTPYPTSDEKGFALLSQMGIGTDIRRSGGADPAQLRGYMEIDEKILDAAIASNLGAINQLFSYDTDGDLLPDSGVAYSIDALAKPYTEIGGIFALKTGSMDSRIAQEQRRIETLDRQLLAKEAELKKQYGQMESAYNRMEQMSSSLDRFQQQNSGDYR